MRSRLLRLFDTHRDTILIVGPVLAMAALAAPFDLFEEIVRLSRDHEYFQIDALVVGLTGAAILYLTMLVSRTRRLRAELRLRRAAEATAEHCTRFDSLTGLASRQSVIDAVEEAAGGAHPVTMFVIDLDRFKPINDTFGHQAGDAALRAVARRLNEVVGPHGIVGRLSGDEFAAMLHGGPEAPAPEAIAEAMLRAIARPIQVPGGMAEVSASLGLVRRHPGECGAAAMLRAADFAMYRAKHGGRAHYVVFASAMEAAMRERAQLEIDMRGGVHRGEFVPHFQPIVALDTGEITGFEALARWNHPTRGLVPPDQFIPIAEEAGLIQELGIALFRSACKAARAWPRNLTLSINISPLQLNDNWLPERILQVLCTTGFAPGRLLVEVTESRLVGDIDGARAILESLKNAGIQIALDDFGTGYASLKHLRELHFNRIKIDRSFVQRLDEAENSQIVRAILKMCDGLALPVTAEGIETGPTASRLAKLGCTYGQGYFYSPPVPAEAALEIARRGFFPRPEPEIALGPLVAAKPRRRLMGHRPLS